MIAMLANWRHSGFNVFCGNRMSSHDATGMENPARFIIRASFSQERMTCLDQEAKVIYHSKSSKSIKVFGAHEWREISSIFCRHVSVEGHTESTGSEAKNKALSKRRADSVVNALVKAGIDAARLSSKGWDQEKPMVDNATEAGRAKNRRVKIVKTQAMTL